MKNIAIRAENLGKRYERCRPRNKWLQRIGLTRQPMGGYGAHALEGDALPAEFWALREASFEIKQGEVVGIVGRNGAGKSTLLKLLSKITEPTTGRAEIRGRVGSLLEVGTGFHPDLTGRENVYLNGAFLGMSRSEVQRRFDEIVAFAEVENFIDSPVKHYSSGMYVRLAFSVAAHLEPEILILDEVLGVGDAAFQVKSHQKMHSLVNDDGRTVILVSHNMIALAALCDSGVYLEQGTTVCMGPIGDVLRAYGIEAPAAESPRIHQWEGRVEDESTGLAMTRSWVRAKNSQGDPQGEITIANDLEIGVEIEGNRSPDELRLGFWLATEHGHDLAYVAHAQHAPLTLRGGKTTYSFVAPAGSIATGRYRIDFYIAQAGREALVSRNAGGLVFAVEDAPSASGDVTSPIRNLLHPSWAA